MRHKHRRTKTKHPFLGAHIVLSHYGGRLVHIDAWDVFLRSLLYAHKRHGASARHCVCALSVLIPLFMKLNATIHFLCVSGYLLSIGHGGRGGPQLTDVSNNPEEKTALARAHLLHADKEGHHLKPVCAGDGRRGSLTKGRRSEGAAFSGQRWRGRGLPRGDGRTRTRTHVSTQKIDLCTCTYTPYPGEAAGIQEGANTQLINHTNNMPIIHAPHLTTAGWSGLGYSVWGGGLRESAPAPA